MAPATKRRRLEQQPEEITFDPSARQEYLTGFHKRKEARKQHARDTAAKKEKEEKVKERKQVWRRIWLQCCESPGLTIRVVERTAEGRFTAPCYGGECGVEEAERER